MAATAGTAPRVDGAAAIPGVPDGRHAVASLLDCPGGVPDGEPGTSLGEPRQPWERTEAERAARDLAIAAACPVVERKRERFHGNGWRGQSRTNAVDCWKATGGLINVRAGRGRYVLPGNRA